MYSNAVKSTLFPSESNSTCGRGVREKARPATTCKWQVKSHFLDVRLLVSGGGNAIMRRLHVGKAG